MGLTTIKTQFSLWFLSFVGLLGFFGSLVYLVYKLDIFGVILTIILAAVSLTAIIRHFTAEKQATKSAADIDVSSSENEDDRLVLAKPRLSVKDYLFLAGYLFIFSLAILLLFNFQTDRALVSPWAAAPAAFFWLYVAGTVIIFAAIFKRARVSLFLIQLHYFLTFGVALIIFKLGYGYDPFIHQASLKLIDRTGVIYPKTFYYLGQYALEIITHKVFFLPLIFIDRLLVPVSAAIFLPWSLNYVLRKKYDDRIIVKLIILLLLVLPSSLFIMTVPQNLAYLFLLTVVILSFAEISKSKLVAIWSLTLAALVTQPIAGLPALVLAVWQTVKYFKFKRRWKKIIAPTLLVFNALAVPALFLAAGQARWQGTWRIFTFAWPQFPNQEDFVLNFIYLIAFNGWLIALIIVLLAGWLAFKSKFLRPYFYAFLSLAASYILSRQLIFNNLAGAEQGDYPGRILITAFIFLVPVFIVLLYQISERLRLRSKFIKAVCLTSALVLITTSLYLSYPREDRYFSSHGYSVSASDIKAADYIAQDAGDKDYIVLANQQVGAAAVSEFGLKKYYQGDQFYYSIQTGYPLYQYYLKMLATPQRAVMEQALDSAGVKQGYFVLDKYWWEAKQINLEAQLQADSWWPVDNGEVYVYKYLRK